MAAFEPFFPNVKPGTTGFTQVLTPSGSSTSVIISTGFVGSQMTALRITNVGTLTSWVRISSEASPTATTNDTPILGNAVALFGAQSAGNIGLAVIATAAGNSLYITPGYGGVGQ
jgi:hypothetical protein